MRILLIAITLTLTCSAASAETIIGPASVIDGDTIQVNGEVIRILEIDAPEKDQFCSQAEGDTTWRCGEQAAFALIDIIGAQVVSCETDKLDRYGAHLAACMAGETNLGEWMAAEGWAVPYPNCKCETLRAASEYAELHHLGLWAEPFILPWEWREAN